MLFEDNKRGCFAQDMTKDYKMFGNISNSFYNNDEKVSNKNNDIEDAYQKHFLLCESCFWCATTITYDLRDSICPICKNVDLQIIDNLSERSIQIR